MRDYKIPKEEQENFAEMYWQLLRAFESKTSKEDILDKHLISEAYKCWERLFGKIN
jgi:ribulose bisphosphate carboxylase small subunit